MISKSKSFIIISSVIFLLTVGLLVILLFHIFENTGNKLPTIIDTSLFTFIPDLIVHFSCAMIIFALFCVLKDIFVSLFISHKNNSSLLNEFASPHYLVICICVIIFNPLLRAIDILNFQIPEGTYNIYGSYTFYSYDEYENYDYFSSGISQFQINLKYDDSNPSIDISNVTLPEFDKLWIEEEFDGASKLHEEEFEIDGEIYHLEYSLEEITPHSLNYTIENELAKIPTSSKIIFILTQSFSLITLAGYFYAIFKQYQQKQQQN